MAGFRPDSPLAEVTVSTEGTDRAYWVDNLRTLVIFLVVNMHACVTYGWVGSWYFMSLPRTSPYEKAPFAFWEAVMQSFFMGLLFFFGGYFADRSLRKRGQLSFTKERIKRLGLPVLIYMLVIHPFVVMVFHAMGEGSKTPSHSLLLYLTSGEFIASTGPMWFAFALLIFSLVFALVGPRLPNLKPKPFKLNLVQVLCVAAGVGLVAFVVRLVEPLGTTWVNFQLCYFAQYVVAFPLGVWVSRRDVLKQLAESNAAKQAGWFALLFGPLAMAGLAVASLPLVATGEMPHQGGFNPYAFSLALWEQLTGFTIGLGLIHLFSKRMNVQTPMSQWLADRSFGVYLLHTPVLVGLSILFQPIRANPVVMALGITLLTVTASYIVADIAKRIPLLKEIL